MDMEEFFGITPRQSKEEKKEQVTEVLQEKAKEIKKMAPHEKKEILDYLEGIVILPNSLNSPDWKAKQHSELDKSLLETIKKSGLI